MPGSNRFRDALVLVLVFAVAYGSSFDPKIDLNGDNAAYLALAESIATGQGYRDIAKPGRPLANHLPPGYPALLALLMTVSTNLIFLKAFNGVLLLVAALLFQALGRALGLTPPLVLVSSVLMVLNAHLLRSATIVMSEIPFLTLTMLALVAGVRAVESARAAWRDPWTWTAAVALAAAMTVRTAGLAVAVAVILWLWIARRRGAAAMIAGTVVAAALPWFLRGRSLEGNSYVHQLLMVNPYDFDAGTVTALDLVHRVGANVVRYAGGEVGVSVYATLRSSAAGGAAGWIASVTVLALVVYGLRRMPRHGSLIALTLGTTFAMLLLWPAPWSGARFLHGVVPLVIVASLVGLVEAVKRGVGWRVPTPVLLALPLLFLPPVRLLHQVARMDYPPAYAAFFRAADWVRAKTPPDAVVCVRKPYLFHWRSGRACDLFPYTADTERVIEALERMNASIVIVDRLGLPATPRYLVPAVAAHVSRFETMTEATEDLVLVLRFVEDTRDGSR